MTAESPHLVLPEPSGAQAELLAGGAVAAWVEPMSIHTYDPAPPERFPMFFERRVYQGSSGRVYPLPFTERIADRGRDRVWQAVHLENRWVRLVLLPELGGRIHVGYDKSAGYDFFYRNSVIKPALVGLAGPWVSGGVEFNWPQHHRPATFLPMQWCIEREDDGAVTVWMSDHDPFARMRGTHGIRLRPDSSVIELRARLHNRTESPQTFLWWANVAARAHADYQSFFPTDVRYVADHARRAVTAFPRADRAYYGVDYPERVSEQHPDADRIDFYSNIPVPTSYMVVQTRDDFFGGYDHAAGAGFVHWADRRIAPGKKQWTWGNAPFGHAWDAHLTDGDGPYVELMAGVFTDNQPDFSFLAPGETRTFSQYWYPISQIGPAHQATRDAAVSTVVADGTLTVGVAVTREVASATVEVIVGATAHRYSRDLAPGRPLLETVAVDPDTRAQDVTVIVTDGASELVRWTPRDDDDHAGEPEVATEPPLPEEIAAADELYLTGVHLAQYRHPTRRPEPYWEAAVARDPGDSRSRIALATAAYDRGEYAAADEHLRAALARLTFRNANPADGEGHYRLGLVAQRRGDDAAAYDAFAKAAWDARWAHPANVRMAMLDAAAGRDADALLRLDEAARAGADDALMLAARVVVLRRLDRADDAARVLDAARRRDPLDALLAALDGVAHGDALTLVDIAGDLARLGEVAAAGDLYSRAAELPAGGSGGAAPVAHYASALMLERRGLSDAAALERERARAADDAWVFPAGLDAHDALAAAVAADPADARARALLGMWMFDRGRRVDALVLWRDALALGGTDPVLLRNAALATMEVEGDADAAAALYERAAAGGDDPRVWYELDQLAVRRGEDAATRLERLEPRLAQLTVRDDLLVVIADLLTVVGRPEEALSLLLSRQLQPWEGGEGMAVRAFARAALSASRSRGAAEAATLLESALTPPTSLGETWHPLDSRASVWLALGEARRAVNDTEGADAAFAWSVAEAEQAAVDVSSADGVRAALERGDTAAAQRVREAMRHRIHALRTTVPRVDYFATSLPETLLFSEPPETAADRERHALEAALSDVDGLGAHEQAEAIA